MSSWSSCLSSCSCAGTEPPHCAWPLPCSSGPGQSCSCAGQRGTPLNRRAPGRARSLKVLASRYTSVASSVESLRNAPALAAIPYRARSTIRRCGTPAPPARPRGSPAQRSALSRFRPEGTAVPLRHRSGADTRDPSGTSRNISRSARCRGVSSRYKVVSCNRSAAPPRSYVPAAQAQLTRTVEAQRSPGDLGAIWPMRDSVPSMKAWARSARRRLRLRA